MKWLILFLPLTAFANEDSILTWEEAVPEAGVPAAGQYNPQRKDEKCALPDSEPWFYLPSVPASILTTTDFNVPEGAIVCYRVSASAPDAPGNLRPGEGDWSNRAEKTVPFVRRGAPANFEVQ